MVNGRYKVYGWKKIYDEVEKKWCNITLSLCQEVFKGQVYEKCQSVNEYFNEWILDNQLENDEN